MIIFSSLMWRRDEFDTFSPELDQVYQSTIAATVLGGIAGMYNESRQATQNFLEKNKYEMFKHPKEAQLALQDRAHIAYIKVINIYYRKL